MARTQFCADLSACPPNQAQSKKNFEQSFQLSALVRIQNIRLVGIVREQSFRKLIQRKHLSAGPKYGQQISAKLLEHMGLRTAPVENCQFVAPPAQAEFTSSCPGRIANTGCGVHRMYVSQFRVMVRSQLNVVPAG